MSQTYYKAINWNEIEDVIDKSTWEKLTEQFWLDTRIPLSNDLDDWRQLSEQEKDLVGKVFGGLTLLDTMQSESGVEAIRADVRTPHEEAPKTMLIAAISDSACKKVPPIFGSTFDI